MKKITVSVDDETHRLARIRAAKLDTSVSALVRHYLRSLVRDREIRDPLGSQMNETVRERRRRLLDELFEDIRVTRGGFRATDNVPREALHEREPIR